MKIIIAFLLSTVVANANVDMGKAAAEGASAGLGAVGGWLVLGVLIAMVFALITRGRKK